MRKPTGIGLGLALATAIVATQPTTALAGSMAHAHMGHVTSGWKDTPGGKGLLPTAIAEAEVAVQHAGFAAKQPDNLAWMQTHVRHVLNAVDPSVEAKGPGKGYGVMKAAMGVAKHINFAAGSDDASNNVKTHAKHVATTAENTVQRAKEIVAVGKQVLAAKSAAEAAPEVRRIAMLSHALLDGADANGDGAVTWHKGEGGLKEASKHMGFMKKGERMKY